MLRSRSPLPDGYKVEEADGAVRLYDPAGVLLHEEPRSATTASAVEERAWRDVWERIARELNEELVALRDGTVRLRELRRVRQYVRMLDAVHLSPPVATPQPRRSDVVAWLALATAAAALALVILTTPMGVPSNPERTALLTAPMRALPRPTVQAPVARRIGPVRVPVRVPLRAVREATGYVVGFGEFADQAAAEVRMRLIRRKGYLVYVQRVGDTLHVVTRPYRTWSQAERLANALQEIGLPATARIARLGLLLRGGGDS
jgi:cell division septation protein DedD